MKKFAVFTLADAARNQKERFQGIDSFSDGPSFACTRQGNRLDVYASVCKSFY